VKKLIFILLLISLIISLILNNYQYKTIQSYQSKQNLNNAELKSTIVMLNSYLNDKDFATISEGDIRTCLWMSERIYTLVKNSTYSSNRDVVDGFNDLDNVFTGLPINKIKNMGEQIKVLLKSTINPNDNEINPNECKKLSEFIRSTM
jgi:hypothetical protein